MRNMTNKCINRYINLLYYKQHSLLHVSATYHGHVRFQYSATSRHNTTICVWCVHTDVPFSNTQQYIILFIYQYFNYFLHTVSYISEWCHCVQGISTCNSVHIILPVFYILKHIKLLFITF
jgi:hypothetical protein